VATAQIKGQPEDREYRHGNPHTSLKEQIQDKEGEKGVAAHTYIFKKHKGQRRGRRELP
jgi:hypothetical protein